MTTGVPEPDSYPDSGGRGWDVRPAVPGWSAGQDYTGPLFDDTGWHIDLSDVDWGDNTGRDYQDHQQGNGAGPATVSYDRAAGTADQASGLADGMRAGCGRMTRRMLARTSGRRVRNRPECGAGWPDGRHRGRSHDG